MKKGMNKKAQDLSIGTLILIVLGIVVLVLLILGFSMGWDNLWKKINIFGGTTSQGDVATACRLAQTSQDTYTLCQKSWKIKDQNNNEETVSCAIMKQKGLLDIELNCPESLTNNCVPDENLCAVKTTAEDCTKDACVWQQTGTTGACKSLASASIECAKKNNLQDECNKLLGCKYVSQ